MSRAGPFPYPAVCCQFGAGRILPDGGGGGILTELLMKIGTCSLINMNSLVPLLPSEAENRRQKKQKTTLLAAG